MGIAQEEADGVLTEMLLQAALELRPHLRAEAVPHKLGQVKGSCFDPFFQADALLQRAGVLTVVFRAVRAFHILGFVSETGMIQRCFRRLDLHQRQFPNCRNGG